MSHEEKDYELRIKRRILILKEFLEEGKIFFADNLKDDLVSSLSKVKYDENGEPDLSTVDGRVRSIALMAEHLDHRVKMKEAISLYDIQERYFSMIDLNLNSFYKIMISKKLTPNILANHIAYKTADIEYIESAIDQILDEITEFWNLLSESAYLHLEDEKDALKAIFGGDLSPQNDENIASKCGIYTDTIILPCPFIRCKNLFQRWDKKQRVYYFLKLGLNILQYRELALADLSTPIVCIVPDKDMMDEFTLEQVQNLGEKDTLYHVKKVFGRDFENIDELIDFGQKLDTVDKVLDVIKDPKKVLFDLDFKEPLKIQIEKQIMGQSAQLMGTDNPGLIVSMLGFGRMSVCNEIILKSLKIGGIPLIDAPTSWEYFKWKLEYDSERAFPGLDFNNLHTIKGLNGLSDTKLSWIGKIPPKGLIEIRKNGSIDEIRHILSNGINELVLSDELDFKSTSKKVFRNLNSAFKEHEKNIENLTKKKWKIAGKDFGTWIVMGTAEIAAACAGSPLFGVPALVLDQILDAPKIKDFPNTIDKMKEVENEKKRIRKTPIGMMFQYKK